MKNRYIKRTVCFALCCIMLVGAGSQLLFTFAADAPNPDDYSQLLYNNTLTNAGMLEDWTLAGGTSFDNGGLHISGSGRAVSPTFSRGRA